jgi:hypothetical protein
MAIWAALLMAILIPLLLGRRRERRWLILALLALLPLIATQLESLGSALYTLREDRHSFRTEPQHLRIGELQVIDGVYDAATDTMSFQLPDRKVVIGPPEFTWPLNWTTTSIWFQGLGVGIVLVSASYAVGIGLGRIWPPPAPQGATPPAPRPRTRSK